MSVYPGSQEWTLRVVRLTVAPGAPPGPMTHTTPQKPRVPVRRDCLQSSFLRPRPPQASWPFWRHAWRSSPGSFTNAALEERREAWKTRARGAVSYLPFRQRSSPEIRKRPTQTGRALVRRFSQHTTPPAGWTRRLSRHSSAAAKRRPETGLPAVQGAGLVRHAGLASPEEWRCAGTPCPTGL